MSEHEQEVARQMEDGEAEQGADVVQETGGESGADESGADESGSESGSGDQVE